jgi:hypothetical protein
VRGGAAAGAPPFQGGGPAAAVVRRAMRRRTELQCKPAAATARQHHHAAGLPHTASCCHSLHAKHSPRMPVRCPGAEQDLLSPAPLTAVITLGMDLLLEAELKL